MKKVAVVICCYNDIVFIDECLSNLKHIKGNAYPELEVIVKDQDSPDKSSDLIESKYPWVKLIKGPNVGLSKAYNIACRSTDAEYILFLGMDAFPNQDAVPGLVEYFDVHPGVGAATCKLVLNDGSLDMDAHRAFPTPWSSAMRFIGLSKLFPKSPVFNGYFLPGQNMNEPHEIDLCISHFMFVRKSILDRIGGFDEDYFLYGEDVDTCYRIKQTGAKIMYLPMWSTRHVKGGDLGIRKGSRNIVKRPLQHRLKMQKLSTQAMEIFLRKHYINKYSKPFVYFMIFSTRIMGLLRVLMESLRD